jgi:histidinol-phosphate aminotransferase
MAAETIEVPLGADLQYDPERLLDAVEEHEPAVVYLCSPNNPTGSVLEPEAIRTIVERSPGIVALDEAYWEFASWNGRALLDRYPHLILFRTFSKAMAMAAARVGYLLAAPELAQEMKKAQPPYPLNRFSQAAALVALARVSVLRERAALVVRERERLYGRLREMKGVSVFPSEGNFLLFRTELGSRRTFEGLVDGGVLVRDVGANPLLREMLRVAVGTPDENEIFLRALGRTLEENHGR